MKRRARGSGVAWLGVVLAGCGSISSEPAPTASASASAAAATSAMSGDALCDALLMSPLDHLSVQCSAADQEALGALKAKIGLARARCSEELARPVQDGRLAIDDAKAAACIAEVEHAGRAWVGPHAEALNLFQFPACRGMLTPRQAAGEVCGTALECEGGLGCVGTEQGAVGKCSLAKTDWVCSPKSLAFGIERRSECPPTKICVPGSQPASGTYGFGYDGVSGGSDARVAPGGRVWILQATASGGLPVEVVTRIVRRNLGGFRTCYAEGLRRVPSLEGRIATRFTIGKDGATSAVSQKFATFRDKEVSACVLRAFKALKFPEPTEKKVVTVELPLSFGLPPAPSTGPKKGDAQVPAPVETELWTDGRAGGCLARALGDASPPCAFHTDCRPEEYCSTAATFGDPNRCVAKKAAGTQCTDSSECRGVCTRETCASFCGSG